MSDTEPVGITQKRLDQLPAVWHERFELSDLPHGLVILDNVFHQPRNSEDKPGEVLNAKKHPDYIGKTDQELYKFVSDLISDCLTEMADYERISREPVEERLKHLKEVATIITRILIPSAPGTYYRLNKEDRYKDDPAMQGAGRLREDQAALLAIVIAGIKEGWPDEELLVFLKEHVLTSNNQKLNALREKARGAVLHTGIRLAYSGREDEIKAVDRVLNQTNSFIPRDCVDFLGPEGVDNTVDQIKKYKEYLQSNLKPGKAYIIPINAQGIRSMRMAGAFHMVPPETTTYVYAMPTLTGWQAEDYRTKEIKGTVFYTLTNQASFTPTPHTLI